MVGGGEAERDEGVGADWPVVVPLFVGVPLRGDRRRHFDGSPTRARADDPSRRPPLTRRSPDSTSSLVGPFFHPEPAEEEGEKSPGSWDDEEVGEPTPFFPRLSDMASGAVAPGTLMGEEEGDGADTE